jgi:acetoin utilization deacetylase AcuC-like enzyme
MTLLYRDLQFLSHETGNHPERAGRLLTINTHLDRNWLSAQCRQATAQPADRGCLARVHDLSYIDEIWAFARSGGGYLDTDTVCGASSFDIAALAAGTVVNAVRQVLGGMDTTALCLVRPPGHHALRGQAMGFCLFNNVAVGAASAIAEFDLDRVLIVDFDVHHGNGTQATFWEEPRVGFLSIHRWPFYPGTGGADERGGGDGWGTTANLPIEAGTSRQEYLEAFTDRLQSFSDFIRPQLVLVSAGFDAHRSDPLGNLGLESEDFATITQRILEVAAAHSGGRVVSVLEGGYNPTALAQSVAEHLERLIDGP